MSSAELKPTSVSSLSVPGNEGLEVYRPHVTFSDIYFPHPGKQPVLKYNHCVDIAKFKGRFIAAWNANAAPHEAVPGQYNFLSVSDDFQNWSVPVRPFYSEGGCENPVETDNQWQPAFINYRDETLFCAWCDYHARKTFIASSQDGLNWRNREVAAAPDGLEGKVAAFATNHGLVTRAGAMVFPFSLPPCDTQFHCDQTMLAGALISTDGGESWQWGDPIAAETWAEVGEDPAVIGREEIALWEPMFFEQADGGIGMLIRNATAITERKDYPHRMLLHAVSRDGGFTWSRARTVEVDTTCSRNFSVAGIGSADSLLMVMNDNPVDVPKESSADRYFLSLYCSPTCDPDLLLPGPLVQPRGGTAFYPNGFVDGGKLYLAYTYPNEIHCSVVHSLPDFSRPFLLPRGGRPEPVIRDGVAFFSHVQSSLGLVLTEAMIHQPQLKLAFEFKIGRYQGEAWPILTLGGKTRQGAVIRAIYSEAAGADVVQIGVVGGGWMDLGEVRAKAWNRVDMVLSVGGFSVGLNGGMARNFDSPLLRKICFGGLYEPPEWPMGQTRSSEVRLNLATLVVEQGDSQEVPEELIKYANRRRKN